MDTVGLIYYIVVFGISLVIVVKGASIFCNNLVAAGKAMGISELVLGCTVSAVGTSMPEFGSSMIAVFTGNPDVGVGCIIGSNSYNIAGIFGITALVAGVAAVCTKEELKRDGLAALGTALLLFFFMEVFGFLNIWMGIILFGAYCIYLWRLIKAQKAHAAKLENGVQNIPTGNLTNMEKQTNFSPKAVLTTRQRLKMVMWVAIGLGGLVGGAEGLVYSSVGIASTAGISQMIIGLTILAIGTSMPETFVTLTSTLKKRYSLAFGNIVGSNTFNILGALGVPALFENVSITPLATSFDAPVMIGITCLLLLLCSGKNHRFGRKGGLLFLGIYLTYMYIRLFVWYQ